MKRSRMLVGNKLWKGRGSSFRRPFPDSVRKPRRNGEESSRLSQTCSKEIVTIFVITEQNEPLRRLKRYSHASVGERDVAAGTFRLIYLKAGHNFDRSIPPRQSEDFTGWRLALSAVALPSHRDTNSPGCRQTKRPQKNSDQQPSLLYLNICWVFHPQSVVILSTLRQTPELRLIF